MTVKRTMIVLSLVLILAGCFPQTLNQTSTKTQDEWLTVPMLRVESYLVLPGPELLQTALDGKLYSYYGHGQHITLTWVGYYAGVNVWEIPQQVKDDYHDWESNTGYATDFSGNYGEWLPFGARPGTHAT